MTNTALVAIQAKLAEQAQAKASQIAVTAGGAFLSTRSGTLSFDDEAMPGNQVCVVITDDVFENTYYEGKWDPNAITSPKCYAFSREKLELAPHPSMQNHPDYFEPQNDVCQTCLKNEWGSADTGKGKACQNRLRLTLVPAGRYIPKKGSKDLDLDLFADGEHFAEADPVFLKLPPTSVEEYAKYVSQLSSAHSLPPHGVFTRIYCEPHPKHQFHVKFEMIERVPDDLLCVVMERHEKATEMPFSPYTPPEEPEAAATAGGLKGLRRR